MEQNARSHSRPPHITLGDVYAVAGVVSILAFSIHLQLQGTTSGWPWPLQALTWILFLGLRADPVQRRMGRGSLTGGNGWRTALGCLCGAGVAAGAGLPELTAAFCAVVIAVHLQWGHEQALRVGGVMTMALVVVVAVAAQHDLVGSITGRSATVLSLAVAGLGLAVVGNLAVLAAQRERTQRELFDAQQAREELLRRSADQDPLTRLLNRRALDAALERAAAQVGPGRGVAVLFCDVDHFKAVNDLHGHAAGDAVLIQVAARLAANVREGAAIGRMGGDEFVVVLGGLAVLSDAEVVAERLRDVLGEPFVVDGVDVGVGVSVGVSAASGPTTARDLLRGADAAMYRAKRTRATPRPAR